MNHVKNRFEHKEPSGEIDVLDGFLYDEWKEITVSFRGFYFLSGKLTQIIQFSATYST